MSPILELDKIITERQFPALPQSATQLLELSRNPDIGPATFALPIESDPSLASQVLRFVNSSFFGFSQNISSIKMAITLVGMRTIKNFALWSAVFSLAPNPKCGPFDLRMLWQDSLRRALFARKMGTLLQLEDPEEVFIAALLQDIAIPLLADYKPEIYSQLMEASKSRNLRLSFVEKKVIGWTHGEAGGKIIRHWMLPDEFACIVEKHHLIDEMDPQQDETPNAFIVALSSLLPSVAQEDWGEKEAFVENFLTFKEISESDIEPVFGNVDEEIGEFAQILRIAPPKVGLREILANSEEEEEDEEKEEGGEGED